MTRFLEDASVGAEIEPYELSITVQRLVMEAASNRDFAPIHHDRDAGRSAGAPDMFANTDFVEMLLEIALRRWIGLEGRIRRLHYRIRDFNVPGDVVTCRGSVTESEPTGEGEGGLVRLDLRVEGPRGITVEGSAEVTLPTRKG